MLRLFALEYDGQGPFGSGGYSRSAKHKPLPRVVTAKGDDLSAPVAGKTRRKLTVFNLDTTPPTLIRRDYALDDLRKLGADLPKLYFDELGNMRNDDDALVMRGPLTFQDAKNRI